MSEILRKSKINILLSKAEGANRGIYEGLFSGNVLIVNKDNLGVNKDVINQNTGFLCGDDELAQTIEKALDRYESFDTGAWARKNTGYIISSEKLNNFIKNLALANNEPWTEDLAYRMNQPNNMYACEADRKRLDGEYLKLEQYLR